MDISKKARLNLIGAAWLLTIAATFPGILYYYWLPIGFFWFFGGEKVAEWNWGFPKCVLYWLPYIVLTLGALLIKRKARFIIIYTILCLVLIVSSVGCREMFANSK